MSSKECLRLGHFTCKSEPMKTTTELFIRILAVIGQDTSIFKCNQNISFRWNSTIDFQNLSTSSSPQHQFRWLQLNEHNNERPPGASGWQNAAKSTILSNVTKLFLFPYWWNLRCGPMNLLWNCCRTVSYWQLKRPIKYNSNKLLAWFWSCLGLVLDSTPFCLCYCSSFRSTKTFRPVLVDPTLVLDVVCLVLTTTLQVQLQATAKAHSHVSLCCRTSPDGPV